MACNRMENCDHRATAHVSSSLYPEYIRMLVSVCAVFSGLWCVSATGWHAGSLIAVGCTLWTVLRINHSLKWQWVHPLITVFLLGLLQWTLLVWQPAVLTSVAHGPLSINVILLALVLSSFVDFVETITRLSLLLETPKARDRLKDFVICHGLRILLWGTVGFVIAYSTLVPLIQELTYVPPEPVNNLVIEMDRLTLPMNFLLRFCEATTGILFFVLGCCVGSYLNVVIYRVPLKISVITKASHCPNCSTKILSRDNLPLVGWLKLRGCCRNCRVPVSARYPLLELTIGLLFLLLYFVELISGGTNLPVRPPNWYAGVVWILFYTKWDLVGLYAFHVLVLCALFCWTMIQRDGHRVPARANAFTIMLTAFAVLICPHLLPFASEISSLRGPDLRSTVVVLFSGTAAGLVSGIVLRRLGGIPQQLFLWPLIGIVYGWQSVIVITALVLVAKFLLTLAGALLEENRITSLPTVDVSTGNDTPRVQRNAGTPEQSEASSPVTAHTGSVPVDAASIMTQLNWWVLPSLLVLHHCLWRHLFFST